MRRNIPMLALGTAIAATLAACGSGGADVPSDQPTDTNHAETREADARKAAESRERYEEHRQKGSGEDEEKPVDEHAEVREIAEAEGKTVLVGKVRIIDGPDIFDYEGVDAEKMGGKGSEDGNTYAILELDEETHVSGVSGDGSPREGDESHVGLGDDIPEYDFTEDTASQWKEYDGKRICVAGHAWFPSDVSFPLSARMSDAEVLYVE